MSAACRNRRFFATPGGSYGLGPQTMQVGDLICVLNGGKWPVVLRRRSDGNECCWVGFCYIQDDDLMYGDRARRNRAEGKAYETFDVR